MDSPTPIAASILIEPKESFVPSFQPQMELPLAVTSSPSEWIQFKKQIREIAQIILNEVLAHKEVLFHLNHSRKQSLFKEIETSAEYLGNAQLPPLNEKSFAHHLFTEDKGDPIGRALFVFYAKVAYFNLLKYTLLLNWHHRGLCDWDLPVIRNTNATFHSVLKSGFLNLVREKHHFLFLCQNNYSWFQPSYDCQEDILEKLGALQSHFDRPFFYPLCELYEAFIEEAQLPLYEFYTPYELANFMWDFLQQHEKQSLFRQLGPHRMPRTLFDPASGCGTLLAVAARRFRAELDQEPQRPKAIREWKQALTQAIFGCETDSFSYYFSEAQLLWELSDLFIEEKELKIAPYLRHSYSFSLAQHNSLNLHEKLQLEIAIPEPTAEKPFDLPPIEGHLNQVIKQIEEMSRFDYVVSAPPELRGSQRRFMKALAQNLPYWKNFLNPQAPYSGWFAVMALSKLREHGKLLFLSEEPWHTSEGAKQVREFILKTTKIIAIIDLGKSTLAEKEGWIPRHLYLLEKNSNAEERQAHRVKIIRKKSEGTVLHQTSFEKILEIASRLDCPGKVYSDSDFEGFFCPILQGEFNDKPWLMLNDTGQGRILKKIDDNGQPLQQLCIVVKRKPHENMESLEFGWAESPFYLQLPETAPQLRVQKTHEISEGCLSIAKKPSSPLSLFYIAALANSKLINFWYHHQGDRREQQKWFTLPSIKKLPIRNIHITHQEPAKAEKLIRIATAIKKEEYDYLKAHLSLELRCGSQEIAHDALCALQEEIFNLEAKLNRYNYLFSEKIRPTSPLPQINLGEAKKIYPLELQHPLSQVSYYFVEYPEGWNTEPFCLEKTIFEVGLKEEASHLCVLSNTKKFIKVYAPQLALELLEKELSLYKGTYWEEILTHIHMPKDLSGFSNFANEIFNGSCDINRKIIKIQEIIDAAVYLLYGFDAEDSDKKNAQFNKDAIEAMIHTEE